VNEASYKTNEVFEGIVDEYHDQYGQVAKLPPTEDYVTSAVQAQTGHLHQKTHLPVGSENPSDFSQRFSTRLPRNLAEVAGAPWPRKTHGGPLYQATTETTSVFRKAKTHLASTLISWDGPQD